MKKSTKIFLLIIGITAMSLYARTNVIEYPIRIPLEFPLKPKIKLVELSIEDEVRLKTHKGFLYAIGHRESSNRYDVINQLGYMGKYQFSHSTLKSLGYNNITHDKFINNCILQEEAMHKLLMTNYKTLKKYIIRYEGKIIHNITITKSGILAAAHLGGAGNVIKWFKRGENFKDGNGITITSYMKQFANYNLEL